ncbi:hypothetical protein C8034_v009886 [Colletotrichum sidae]|uniref:Uncharacterized protein n=1 Tax=Colletotrichum sidae TaxID=1347389 RepID=A0A4R8TUX5_9PEZI|nr:hypothetical protein C8034_v009886 [Colletotrichum sidae]
MMERNVSAVRARGSRSRLRSQATMLGCRRWIALAWAVHDGGDDGDDEAEEGVPR